MYKVLGVVKPSDLVRSIRLKTPFFPATSCTLKIRRQPKRLTATEDLARNEKRLEQTLSEGAICVTDRGGYESATAEMILSVSRMVGIRLCYP